MADNEAGVDLIQSGKVNQCLVTDTFGLDELSHHGIDQPRTCQRRRTLYARSGSRRFQKLFGLVTLQLITRWKFDIFAQLLGQFRYVAREHRSVMLL
jgi:hypothetical protein